MERLRKTALSLDETTREVLTTQAHRFGLSVSGYIRALSRKLADGQVSL